MRRLLLTLLLLSLPSVFMLGSRPTLYKWERARRHAPEFTDMVLCYGGSHHRKVYEWDKDRFNAYVTYTDTAGREHWLFDAFLCLEFADLDKESGVKHALMADQVDGPSGGRKNWQNMIDYWFSDANGLKALDRSIAETAERLGKPGHKRQVVMFIPDPIPYLYAKDSGSSHVYWGELDGHRLDFLDDSDRLAACRWYVDTVRKRFSKGRFKNIELAGFYVMSECITIPSEPWTDHGKLHDLIPRLSDYLHSVNECLYWIPFSQGAGWRRGRELGFDYVWMQPNHFWRGDDCPMDTFAGYLRDEGIGMEFEFDMKVYESNPNHQMYRDRFRGYMRCAVQEGIYGSQPITYYVDSNCVYDLSRSESSSDKAFYHEFCSFVINNPLRRIE